MKIDLLIQIKYVYILAYVLFISSCGCTGNLLVGNSKFEEKMQEHIGATLYEKIGPLSIENLLKENKSNKRGQSPFLLSFNLVL